MALKLNCYRLGTDTAEITMAKSQQWHGSRQGENQVVDEECWVEMFELNKHGVVFWKVNSYSSLFWQFAFMDAAIIHSIFVHIVLFQGGNRQHIVPAQSDHRNQTVRKPPSNAFTQGIGSEKTWGQFWNALYSAFKYANIFWFDC